MGTNYRELFKLYDLIQNGEISSLKCYLRDNIVAVNDILPCKGIGLLHLAVGVDPPDKSEEFTDILLKYGADPNVCNNDGITPLHIAAIWGRVDNLKLLIGCGGDPSLQDLDGHSSFDYAVKEEQWEVYDYLHNVVDPLDDSINSPCGYSLDLDKVLVTTDEMVAQYEPITQPHLSSITAPRKSEMIRDWCEKTSLVVNKLYPTVINDTYLIENESVPWKSIDFTKNITLDLTESGLSNDNLNETSFKTCLSKKLSDEVDISGIQRLEITSDESKDSCSCSSQLNVRRDHRMSIYENFSLPGSPNSIIHKNYHTKSSLKKSKCYCKDKTQSTFNTQSLGSDDSSQRLDKAMVIVQNRTNEWLWSSNEGQTSVIKDQNTRRSSASSGVSSNYSSGSIVIANMQEEYKYEDKEEDVVLIEKRLLVSPIVLPLDEAADTSSPDQTIISVASSLPPSVQYDNNTLKEELVKLGFKPGPIQDSTRTLYLKKLQALKKSPIVVKNQGKTYSVELEKSLRDGEWMKNLSPYIELENKARASFASADRARRWRGGDAKTSFSYLLLDPRVASALPARAAGLTPVACWNTFLDSIFYVGKGKRSRPYSHLYQALTLWKKDFTTSRDKKVQHILDIWSDKVGVICLHIFQNVIPAEAYTYEAAMIDAIGLQNLKNIKAGNYYGATASWPLKEKKLLGLYLLYKAMLIFFNEGERQLRPDDID
ncbi:ankyrin repeat and LEM domain-containing protein 1-like [Plodia interpunctella]|uniref:ankyrin repeat and LEM domain-containing protein 1-like n=1 Tax=Plodia interpunctella TaxID=58824 RepID=UPI002367FA18|nr:ankyrin repeat and LEM domain-containing protein 1-like [Plodia interpunctella]